MVWRNGWNFDASRSSHRQSFPELMEFVRSTLGVRGIVMQEARRLPPQQENPRLQDLDLVYEGTTITLRLRTDNLYLVGFRNTAGQWFRFRGSSPIPGVDSDELPVNEGYTGSNGLGSVADSNLSTEAVKNAIIGVARYGGGRDDELARWLRTLIVSFIESIRLTGVADTVAAGMRGAPQVLSDRHLVNQINNWASISTALIQAANDIVQNPITNLFEQFNIEPSNCNIRTAYAAAVALGLVITSSKLPTRGPRLLQYTTTAAAAAAGYDDVSLGLTLLEVLSVVIIDIDGEDPGDLYGEVLLRDSFGSVNLFHRDRSDVQSVRPGDQAKLVWPHRAISAADNFVIDLNLMDRDRDLSPDDEVSRGEVLWNSREGVGSSCNVELSTLVTGKNGSAKVLYAVLTNAVVATVEVLLIDGDGESVPDVYGTITAATKMGRPAGASLDYDLFRQTRSDQVSVPVNTNIPLRRKVITAVLGSPLTVAADLWDKDSFPDPSPDDQIALGSVDFQPRFQESEAKQITGPNGKVEVRVTWLVSHYI